MKKRTVVAQIALLLLAFVALEMTALAATISTRHKTKSKHKVTESTRAHRRMSRLRRLQWYPLSSTTISTCPPLFASAPKFNSNHGRRQVSALAA